MWKCSACDSTCFVNWWQPRFAGELSASDVRRAVVMSSDRYAPSKLFTCAADALENIDVCFCIFE